MFLEALSCKKELVVKESEKNIYKKVFDSSSFLVTGLDLIV